MPLSMVGCVVLSQSSISALPRLGIVDSVFVRCSICLLNGSIAPAVETGGVELGLFVDLVDGFRISFELLFAALRSSAPGQTD